MQTSDKMRLSRRSQSWGDKMCWIVIHGCVNFRVVESEECQMIREEMLNSYTFSTFREVCKIHIESRIELKGET